MVTKKTVEDNKPPTHDNPPPKPIIVGTNGVYNLVQLGYLAQCSKLIHIWNAYKKRCLGKNQVSVFNRLIGNIIQVHMSSSQNIKNAKNKKRKYMLEQHLIPTSKANCI
jgi:hypothetical protein